MHYIVTKFIEYVIRTFLDENPDTGQIYSFRNSVLILGRFYCPQTKMGIFFNLLQAKFLSLNSSLHFLLLFTAQYNNIKYQIHIYHFIIKA